jgi:hypothetical protein
MAAKSTKTKDETTAFATEVNGQLINASGIGNVESPPKAKNTTQKGEKNKKTTEGVVAGKEKAKNRRESSLDSSKETNSSNGGDSKPKKKNEDKESK